MRSKLVVCVGMAITAIVVGAGNAEADWGFCSAYTADGAVAVYSDVWEANWSGRYSRNAESAFLSHLRRFGYPVTDDDVGCWFEDSRRASRRELRDSQSDDWDYGWTVESITWTMSGSTRGVRGRSNGEQGCYFGECPDDSTDTTQGPDDSMPFFPPPNQSNQPTRQRFAQACQIYQPVFYFCGLPPGAAVVGQPCWCPTQWGSLVGVAVAPQQ